MSFLLTMIYSGYEIIMIVSSRKKFAIAQIAKSKLLALLISCSNFIRLDYKLEYLMDITVSPIKSGIGRLPT
ncbi:hypothetical protein B0O99DRAFT_631218 [Bisporella sp. PMI_857]|nr:hypothetical protein B0O99DRAFT_631218 [Bisporella sp. PMI_857]